MAIKRYKAEQIVTLLRQIEVGHRQRQAHTASLQRGSDYGADLLALAQGVRRAEVGTGEADEGTGERETRG
jgi:hypothetical protein